MVTRETFEHGCPESPLNKSVIVFTIQAAIAPRLPAPYRGSHTERRMRDYMTLTGVLDELNQAVDGERVSLGQLVAALNQRGFGPLLLAPALIAMLPTGAIPGVPTICALTITLSAAQLALGRRSPWLRRRELNRQRFDRAYRLARPVTNRLDRLIRPRLVVPVGEPVSRLLALLCCLLAVAMIPLELVPLAAAMPATAIVFLALGLSARDGLLVLVGLAAAVGAIAASLRLWL